jgi:hypothetical protein
MKSFKQISEAVKEDAVFDMDDANEIVDALKSKYKVEVAMQKSTLGGEDRATFFFKVFGPKETWTNGIAMNSPLSMMISVSREGTIESGNLFAYQLKNAGVKPFRKAKYRTVADAKKKVLAYFEKNWDKIKTVIEVNEEVNEDKSSSGYEIKHKTYSGAVQHAAEVAKKRGYEVDAEDWDNKIATGPRKPGKGKTNRFIIGLKKGGKDTPRTLHIQVYNADDAFYELNMYID